MFVHSERPKENPFVPTLLCLLHKTKYNKASLYSLLVVGYRARLALLKNSYCFAQGR